MSPQPLASPDAVRNLYLPVVQAMRELADRLSAFCSESDQERISILSAELKGIGWNSLFVGSSIDRFLQMTGFNRSSAGDTAGEEFQRQLDRLLVATKYLERSVMNLKELELEVSDISKEHRNAYARLTERLGEIIRECQRSAN